MPKRGYLSKNAYFWQKEYLCQRDGRKCAICGRTEPSTKLDVEHLDTNTFNHNPGNLRLLCRVCNLAVRKQSIASKAKLCLKDSRQIVCMRDKDGAVVRKKDIYGDAVVAYKRAIASGDIKADSTVTLSILMRDALEEWLRAWLSQHGFITYHDAKYAGANEMHGSPVCAESWLKTWSNKASAQSWIEIVKDNGQSIILLRETVKPVGVPAAALPPPRLRDKHGRYIAQYKTNQTKSNPKEDKSDES
ncbi:MAG: HNH endonuclease [Dehalococcoidia bacterium]|nr:HNH endonuclease [Dehalococcoidia bacterium]